MIYIAMGANLPGRYGAPAEALEKAKASLKAQNVEIVKSSRTWLSSPVPASDQPHYHNAVLEVRTDLSEHALLKLLHAIEHEFGRVRLHKNEARVLDLDLLAYGERVINSAELQLPHPRMHERAFVLTPLQEIAPGWRHPVRNKTPAEMMADLVLDDGIAPLSTAEKAA